MPCDGCLLPSRSKGRRPDPLLLCTTPPCVCAGLACACASRHTHLELCLLAPRVLLLRQHACHLLHHTTPPHMSMHAQRAPATPQQPRAWQQPGCAVCRMSAAWSMLAVCRPCQGVAMQHACMRCAPHTARDLPHSCPCLCTHAHAHVCVLLMPCRAAQGEGRRHRQRLGLRLGRQQRHVSGHGQRGSPQHTRVRRLGLLRRQLQQQ